MAERSDIEGGPGSPVRTVVLLAVFIFLTVVFHKVADPARHPLATLLGEVACLASGVLATVLVVSHVVLHVLARGARGDRAS